MADDVFHRDFKAAPYWWEAYQPTAQDPLDLPARVRVAIVGGGYGGLSTALEAAKHGVDCVVLEAAELGFGASTRNGGGVSGGVNIGKSFSGRTLDPESERAQGVLADGADAFGLIERLIAEENIACHWKKTGRFVGAWTPKHYAAQAKKIAHAERCGEVGSVHGAARTPARGDGQRLLLWRHGGGTLGQSASGAVLQGVAGRLPRTQAFRSARVPTSSGSAGATAVGRCAPSRGSVQADEVVIATNGYTGDMTPELKRRVVPLASHIIATEELPADLAASLIPRQRTLADTRRVLCYYRMSPDGRRVIFGGRARFTPVTPRQSAPILYRFMTDRFPQLRGVKITHGWTGNVAFTLDALPHMGRQDGMHYLLGCNGSGVAMMTYLGWQTARKIAGVANRPSAFDTEDFPTHPLYTGTPVVPACHRRMVSVPGRPRSAACRDEWLTPRR